MNTRIGYGILIAPLLYTVYITLRILANPFFGYNFTLNTILLITILLTMLSISILYFIIWRITNSINEFSIQLRRIAKISAPSLLAITLLTYLFIYRDLDWKYLRFDFEPFFIIPAFLGYLFICYKTYNLSPDYHVELRLKQIMLFTLVWPGIGSMISNILQELTFRSGLIDELSMQIVLFGIVNSSMSLCYLPVLFYFSKVINLERENAEQLSEGEGDIDLKNIIYGLFILSIIFALSFVIIFIITFTPENFGINFYSLQWVSTNLMLAGILLCFFTIWRKPEGSTQFALELQFTGKLFFYLLGGGVGMGVLSIVFSIFNIYIGFYLMLVIIVIAILYFLIKIFRLPAGKQIEKELRNRYLLAIFSPIAVFIGTNFLFNFLYRFSGGYFFYEINSAIIPVVISTFFVLLLRKFSEYQSAEDTTIEVTGDDPDDLLYAKPQNDNALQSN